MEYVSSFLFASARGMEYPPGEPEPFRRGLRKVVRCKQAQQQRTCEQQRTKIGDWGQNVSFNHW
jgi:hypothetical protein